MTLNDLQKRLETIYAVQTPHVVEDFVVTDRRLANTLDAHPSRQYSHEKLLVNQHEQELNLSLFLDPTVLAALETQTDDTDPAKFDLEAFCTALEGVSHFLYLVWRAEQEQPVSLLELELQAEVDKYVVCAALFAKYSHGELPASLPSNLFDNVRYDPNLDRPSRQRYEQANLLARRYCQILHRTLLSERNGYRVTREIRRFYRLPHHHKLQHAKQLLN